MHKIISIFFPPHKMSEKNHYNRGDGGRPVTVVLLFASACFMSSMAWTHSAKAKFFGKSPTQIMSSAGFCLDEDSGKLKKGGKLIVWNCNVRDFPKERQLFVHLKSGQIRAWKSDLCVDLETGKARKGEHLILWNCNRSGPPRERQIWTFEGRSSYGRLRHVSGFCMDVTADGKKKGQALLYPCQKNNPTQLWTFLENVPPMPKLSERTKKQKLFFCGVKMQDPFKALELIKDAKISCRAVYKVPKKYAKQKFPSKFVVGPMLRHTQSWGAAAGIQEKTGDAYAFAGMEIILGKPTDNPRQKTLCGKPLKPGQTLVLKHLDKNDKKGSCFVATRKGRDWGW